MLHCSHKAQTILAGRQHKVTHLPTPHATLLDFAPSRKLFLDVTPPVILYTDASDAPERVPQQVLGAVLIDGDDIQHTYWAVSPSIISRWIQKQNHMSQLELLAAPLALSTWQSKLFRRDILLFIDNEGACANLVKGFSPQTDSCAIYSRPLLAHGVFIRTEYLH